MTLESGPRDDSHMGLQTEAAEEGLCGETLRPVGHCPHCWWRVMSCDAAARWDST